MTKTLNQIIFFFLHQNQNIFFSSIGNQNIFLEKNHNIYLQVKWFVPKKWVDKITSLIPLYKGLTFLTFENLEKGKIHPLYKVNCHTEKDISRLSVKLKLLTGSYILQSKRIRMYKTETEATCLQCKDKEETMEHFILGCRCLETVHNPVLHELVNELRVWYWLLAA
jgi:hypothetical protein